MSAKDREQLAIRYADAKRDFDKVQKGADKYLKTVSIYQGAGGEVNILGMLVKVDPKFAIFLKGIAARKLEAATTALNSARDALNAS